MLTKRSGNKVLLIELNSLATKFCLQNGLATKFFLQNGGGVMHPLFILYAPPVYITKWGAYPQVSTTCIWHRQYRFHRSFRQPSPITEGFSTQVLLAKLSGNQVLLTKPFSTQALLWKKSLATTLVITLVPQSPWKMFESGGDGPADPESHHLLQAAMAQGLRFPYNLTNYNKEPL